MDYRTASRFYDSLCHPFFDLFTDEIEGDGITSYNSSSWFPRRGCGQDVPHLKGIKPTFIRRAYDVWITVISWFRIGQAPIEDLNSPELSHLGSESHSDSYSDCHEPPSSAISRLPDEILVGIISYLDPSSTYLLAQSSTLFRRLFGDRRFCRHHATTQRGSSCTTFAIRSLTVSEQAHTARILQRDMFCNVCLETRNGSDWDARLANLQELLYCHGCKREHPRLLFFPEDIEDHHERGFDKLFCVGLLGRVTLCSHSTYRTTTTWRTIESLSKGTDNIVCTHPSHRPPRRKGRLDGVSASPRLSLWKIFKTGCDFAFGWDVPLLYIDQYNSPSLEAIHEALVELLKGNLNNQRVCKHVSRGGYLRSFVRSGVCLCFSQPGGYLHPFSKDSRNDCFCDRERYLTCKDCGASFAWYLDSGRVILMHRYVWEIERPTSSAWLAILDEDSYRNRLFVEDTRHVLWCDAPQCAVGQGRRWESLVKINMKEKEPMRLRGSDYERAEERSEETGYRMPLVLD